MLKFKNSYELISHLMKEKLLTGFYLSSGGIHYDMEIHSEIKDTNLIKHLESIFQTWMLNNATHEGFYDFVKEENEDLNLFVYITDDILGYDGNPFCLNEIFANFISILKIDFFEGEDYKDFELDFLFELTLEYNRTNNKGKFSKFNLNLDDEDCISKKEFNLIKKNLIKELKSNLENYFIENMNSNYSDFSVSINKNYFQDVTGRGYDEFKLTDYLKNDNKSYELKH